MAWYECLYGGGSTVSGVIVKSIRLSRGTTGSVSASYGFTAHMADESKNTVTFSSVAGITFQSLSNCTVSGSTLTVIDTSLDFSFTGRSSGGWNTDFAI